MTFLNPYLNFNGECKAAMNFYKECIGGELTLQTVAETPMAAQCPAGMQDQIMHAMLLKDRMCLMASDMIGPEGYIKGTNFSISVNCGSEEEINNLFAGLSADGHIIDPLKTQFWGAIFGVFTDKFGIRWMLNYDKNMVEHKAAE